MSDDRAQDDAARFRPHAADDMAEMFDDVSGRYDLINRLLSLGRDGAWRRAMWAAVPRGGRVVLDLCTGSGASLPGLRRPGRLVIGADVSLRMLELATSSQRTTGWSPRLLCADAFRLPLRSATVDAVTIAFGMRNLRPRGEALAEIGRVLAPDGLLIVLEAAAPAPGPFAPLHRFYLEKVVPAAGRLSDDPSAYDYLSRSILEFGAGPEFEAALADAGFGMVARRSFLFGATRLWVARRSSPIAQIAAVDPTELHDATSAEVRAATLARSSGAARGEWRAWMGVQAAIAAALAASLVFAGVQLAKFGGDLPLGTWQRRGAWGLIVGGALVFGFRALALLARIRG